MSTLVVVAGLLLLSGTHQVVSADASRLVVAQQGGAHHTPPEPPASGTEKEPTPEERMRGRYPQPIKVGDLIGLPVLDYSDRTLGRVRHVVRTPQGKVELIVNYGGWFGWGGRLVAVPIEVVAILGRQLAALDMRRPQFEAAPTWSPSSGQDIPPADTIRIGIARR